MTTDESANPTTPTESRTTKKTQPIETKLNIPRVSPRPSSHAQPARPGYTRTLVSGRPDKPSPAPRAHAELAPPSRPVARPLAPRPSKAAARAPQQGYAIEGALDTPSAIGMHLLRISREGSEAKPPPPPPRRRRTRNGNGPASLPVPPSSGAAYHRQIAGDIGRGFLARRFVGALCLCLDRFERCWGPFFL